MKIVNSILSGFFVLCITPNIYSQENRNFTMSAGVKGYVEKSDTSTFTYYKPFASGGVFFTYADIYASYYRWQSYSVVDASGNEKEININEPGINIDMYPIDKFTISAGYSYLKGDLSYKENKFNGGLEYDMDSFLFGLEYSRDTADYIFNGNNETIENSICASFEKRLSKAFSFEASYELRKTKYDSYGYDITDNTFRIGILGWPSKTFSYFAGIGFGYDSEKVMTPGFDAGATFKINEMIKITLNYALNGNIQETTGTGGGGGGAGGSGSGKSTTKYDTSFTHSASAGISLYY
jgi:hypothetical protein